MSPRCDSQSAGLALALVLLDSIRFSPSKGWYGAISEGPQLSIFYKPSEIARYLRNLISQGKYSNVSDRMLEDATKAQE